MLLTPFIPDSAEKIFDQIGACPCCRTWEKANVWGSLRPDVTVHKGEALFPRIDAEKALAELNAIQEAQRKAALPALELEPYTQEQAGAVIDQVEAFAARHLEKQGTRLVWCSDEFYLIARRPLPEEEFFEEFTQLDNGVGMLRMLMEEFGRGLKLMEPEELAQARPFSIATGVSAGPFLAQLVDLAREKCGTIEGKVYPIANRFFGETITVAGLVTGGDLIDQLRGKDLGERLLIPTNMLRAGERVFLDDVSLDDVERELGVPVIPVAQDGYELLDAMCGLATAPPDFKPNLPEDEYYRYNPGTR